jgi:putative transposase
VIFPGYAFEQATRHIASGLMLHARRWSLDFLADTLVSGRRFRILTLVDDFIRECLDLVVDTSLTGSLVARELDRIAELWSYPCMIVSDNGTELT